ncbi:MAG: DUF1385 domain-containing protein [Chloroflexi bacterium]|nr:DUF1385 domain-containing protein [Chloroflexota bacterium]MCL5110004.1 DUF1385 domain-containing protein [Chloroflexota bacterium]
MAKPSYGGQAVIEGVMMRGQRNFAVAVREPSGKITVLQEPLQGAIYTKSFFKLPFLRGPIVLWDTLALGMRTLMYSANVQLAAEGEGEKAELSEGAMWGTVAVALLVAVGVFFVAPAFLMSAFFDRYLDSALLSNLIEKVIRLTLIVGYIAAIGTLPDIRRVFAFHGAEHKAINAFEHGDPLDVAHAQRYTTAHPRCGTSFLLVVVVVSFIAFSMLGQPPMLERIISRILLIPVVAAIAYEFIKFAALRTSNPLLSVLLAPGMWLQKLTTREPDDSQVEVALVALQHALAADGLLAEVAQPVAAGAASEPVGLG